MPPLEWYISRFLFLSGESISEYEVILFLNYYWFDYSGELLILNFLILFGFILFSSIMAYVIGGLYAVKYRDDLFFI